MILIQGSQIILYIVPTTSNVENHAIDVTDNLQVLRKETPLVVVLAQPMVKLFRSNPSVQESVR